MSFTLSLSLIHVSFISKDEITLRKHSSYPDLSVTRHQNQPIVMAPGGRLEGKVAIVTGGASGFGRGIATKFAEEGARVVLADVAEEAGAAAAAALAQCAFVRADVTRAADWAALLQTALDRFGRLDVVVNNAGATYANKPTETVTEADFDLVMAVNVKSVWLSAHVLLPYFLDGPRPGCFLQVASTAGVRPRPNLTWYNASKAAVINATKVREGRQGRPRGSLGGRAADVLQTMAVEYGPKQIRFNSVSPVVGSTGM